MGLFGMFRKNREIMEVSEQNMYAFIEKWLDSILSQKIPKNVVAFYFILYETGDNIWSIELVGTNTFDLEDNDWCCNEVFHFKLREDLLTWKEEKKWNEILDEITNTLKKYLEQGQYSNILKNYQGIGVGFDDGDVNILYVKQK